MADPVEILWEGEDECRDQYRIAGYDDSYGGVAWAIEWKEDGRWVPISSGDFADAGECAVVAAQIAKELKEARDG